jgi:predicted enzyme related to lactoylglutathione lyase
MKLTHVRLLTSDVPGLVRFYAEALGLEMKIEISEGFYAEMVAGDVLVALYSRERMVAVGAAAEPPSGDRAVLTFDVEDVDGAFARAVGAGATPVTEPHDQEAWFLRVAHVRDPEGNLIELNKSTYEGAQP